jgi:hypothetical protein
MGQRESDRRGDPWAERARARRRDGLPVHCCGVRMHDRWPVPSQARGHHRRPALPQAVGFARAGIRAGEHDPMTFPAMSRQWHSIGTRLGRRSLTVAGTAQVVPGGSLFPVELPPRGTAGRALSPLAYTVVHPAVQPQGTCRGTALTPSPDRRRRRRSAPRRRGGGVPCPRRAAGLRTGREDIDTSRAGAT